MRGFPKTKKHVEAHARRVVVLGQQGWKQEGGYWISPRSGLRYSEGLAINIEELRGTFGRQVKLGHV